MGISDRPRIISSVDPAMRQLAYDPDHHMSVWGAAVWMVVLSLALFFVPAVNGLIAGAVGGYLVGSMSRALAAAVLPAAVVALGLWVFFSLMGFPVIGLLAGGAVSLWIMLSEVGLFIGALLGGAVHHAVRHA